MTVLKITSTVESRPHKESRDSFQAIVRARFNYLEELKIRAKALCSFKQPLTDHLDKFFNDVAALGNPLITPKAYDLVMLHKTRKFSRFKAVLLGKTIIREVNNVQRNLRSFLCFVGKAIPEYEA
ncbi:MAG: hypothetical protein AB7T49_08155 [Oligoflexales bacterium]